jgi:NodT family efflux transporter outer membrane factor (OMF) lipoprotein
MNETISERVFTVRILRSLALLLASMLLVSCGTATSVKPVVQNLSEAKSYEWWLALNDPLLNQLVTDLQKDNLDIQIAMQRLEEARGLVKIDQADLFPKVDLKAGGDRANTRKDKTTGFADAGFDAQWELDLFGQTRNKITASKAREQSIEADVKTIRYGVIADLARAVVSWRTATEEKQTINDLMVAQETQISLFAAREEAGLIDASFTQRAKAQRAQTAVQYPIAQADAQRAIYQMALLMGLKPDGLTAIITETTSQELTVPALEGVLALSTENIAQRPDIAAARALVVAAKADIARAESALWPTLTLGSFFGVQEISSGEIRNPAWSMAANIMTPVIRFGALRAAIRVANAREKQALLNYQKTILQAMEEVQSTLSDTVQGINAVSAQQRALQDRKEALALAQERFDRGLDDMVDLTTAQAELDNAALALISQKSNTIVAFIRLQKALAI